MLRVGWIRLMTFALSLMVNLSDRGLSVGSHLVQGLFSVITSMARIALTPKEKN